MLSLLSEHVRSIILLALPNQSYGAKVGFTGGHWPHSLILGATVKWTVFPGEPSLKGKEYTDEVSFEAVKTTLDLVEKKIIFHFETDTTNATVLDFHTYLELRIFKLHKCSQTRRWLTKFRNGIQRTQDSLVTTVDGRVMMATWWVPYLPVWSKVSMWFFYRIRYAQIFTCTCEKDRKETSDVIISWMLILFMCRSFK